MKNDKNFKRDAKNELTAGREEMMARLLEENRERALCFAYRLIRNQDLAQDLVQEASLKVLRHGKKYDPLRSFTSWYLTVIKNLFLDGQRKRAEARTLSLSGFTVGEGKLSLEDSLADHEPNQEKRMEDAEISREIMRAFLEIPRRYQKILTLCVIEGQDYAMAAKKTGVSIGTVKSRMNRAKKALLKKVNN